VGGEKIDAVLDAVGKSPIEDLISLAPQPSQVVTIANYGAGGSGARLTGGGSDSQPMKALAEAADLLEQNKLVVKVQTFPLDRAVEAHRASQAGHVRGKLVLLPEG
jgi:NADPH:quinone reductase-like Zn-dependent oxidoreductase